MALDGETQAGRLGHPGELGGLQGDVACRGSVLGGPGEHGAHQGDQLGVWEALQRQLHLAAVGLGPPRQAPQGLARGALPGEDAQPEDVGCGAQIAEHRLGRHVAGRAQREDAGLALALVHERLSGTEVEEHGLAPGGQAHVGRLDVAVDYLDVASGAVGHACVGGLQGRRQLGHELCGGAGAQGSDTEQVSKIGPLDILGHEGRAPVDTDEVDEAHDGAMPEQRQHAGLVAQAAGLGSRIVEAGAQHLHRGVAQDAGGGAVAGEPDDAVGAGAQLLDELDVDGAGAGGWACSRGRGRRLGELRGGLERDGGGHGDLR